MAYGEWTDYDYDPNNPYGTPVMGPPQYEPPPPVYEPPPPVAPPTVTPPAVQPIAPGSGDPNSATPPQLNTGGIQPPRYQGGGISLQKWMDPNNTHPKYVVLRILDQVSPAEARRQFAAGSGSVVDQLKALGFSIDSNNKISRSDLGKIDVIHSDNKEFGWNTNTGGGTGDINPPGGGNAPGGDGSVSSHDGDNDPMAAFLRNGGANAPGTGGANGLNPWYTEPWMKTFEGSPVPQATPMGEFRAPSWEDVLKDPGYLFRENRLKDAAQNNAASRGLLHSVGTIEDILGSVGNFASQEYGTAYNRARDTYGTNQNTNAQNFNQMFGLNQEELNRQWRSYSDEKDSWFTNRNSAFDKLFRLADLGKGAAAGA